MRHTMKPMPSLRDWFSVRFDDDTISWQVNPPDGDAWSATMAWKRIVRVCLKTGDWLESDVVYIFTDERPESYVVPTEADGGSALWSEILRRHFFDADLAIQAATTTNELFCFPLEIDPAESSRLVSAAQLPELEGERLTLIWDQLEAETLISHAGSVVWQERTGWEVYDRFEDIAVILKEKYGKRLTDLLPTSRSLFALYGDSTAALFRVERARASLGRTNQDHDDAN
jgi:hypothetical protein